MGKGRLRVVQLACAIGAAFTLTHLAVGIVNPLMLVAFGCYYAGFRQSSKALQATA